MDYNESPTNASINVSENNTVYKNFAIDIMSKETVEDMFKTFVNKLKSFRTNNYQGDCAFVGEPISIAFDNYDGVDDYYNKYNNRLELICMFQFTDHAEIISWAKKFAKDNDLPKFNLDIHDIMDDDESTKVYLIFEKDTLTDMYILHKDMQTELKISNELEKQKKVAFLNIKSEQETTISAFAQIKEMITSCKEKITEEHVSLLCNNQYCKKRASLSYALLLKKDPNISYKEQTKLNGKCRYAKQPISLLNDMYYITNHIFKRNIEKVKFMLHSMNLL